MESKTNPTKQKLMSALMASIKPGSSFISFKDAIVESVFDEVAEVALNHDEAFFNGRRFGHTATDLGSCLYALVISYQGITSDSLKEDFIDLNVKETPDFSQGRN